MTVASLNISTEGNDEQRSGEIAWTLTVPNRRSTRTRVQEIYEDLAQGRMEQLVGAFDEHVDFLSHAPTEVFPYLGRRRGRADVMSAISEMHQRLEIIALLPLTIMVEGNKSALTVFMHVKDRSTGNTAKFLAAHFLRFHAGRISEFCGIIDLWTRYASCPNASARARHKQAALTMT